jgi:hypothetical protein
VEAIGFVGPNVPPPAAARETVSRQDPEATFLGFRVGEEVRYALEADDDRHLDRVVHWTIALEQIEAGGASGTFALGYLHQVSGQRIAQAIADVEINPYGFPTHTTFTAERVTAAGTIGYTIEYTLDDDRFVKVLSGGAFRDQEIDLDEQPHIDLSFPRGLFLYNPIDPACAGALEEMPPEGTTGGAAGPPVIEQLCGGRELLFANPGLLSLAMPSLWDTGTGLLRFVAFAPTGVRLDLFTAQPGSSSPLTVGGIPIGALFGGGPDPFEDGDLALQPLSLTSGSELLQVDVGGRAVDAWRLDPPAPFGAVYVDGNGSIVRLDLPDDPETGAKLWVRRLRPSEF